MADRKRKRTSNAGNGRRSVRSKSRRRKKQNKGRLMFCIAMELIVVLILVLVVGWNYGMGTQLFDWIEQMRKPVVKELDISGINSPYAVLMQVRGGRVIGEINGEEQMYPASMTKIMTTIVAIENLKDLDQEITLTNEMFEGLYEQDATQAGFQPGETVRARLRKQQTGYGRNGCRRELRRRSSRRTEPTGYVLCRCRQDRPQQHEHL